MVKVKAQVTWEKEQVAKGKEERASSKVEGANCKGQNESACTKNNEEGTRVEGLETLENMKLRRGAARARERIRTC